MPFISRRSDSTQKSKKKPPPRPPPPNISKYKSKSTFNLQQTDNLIELSPPQSPKAQSAKNFGGSVSSSYSSSTSSLSSSKKSSEYEFPVTNNIWPINSDATSRFRSYITPSNDISTTTTTKYIARPRPHANHNIAQDNSVSKLNIPPVFGPTIIRAQGPVNRTVREVENIDCSIHLSSPLPMPTMPPPSPPKDVNNVNVAYGIALYDYEGTDPRDLSFQVSKINKNFNIFLVLYLFLNIRNVRLFFLDCVLCQIYWMP